MVSISGVDVKIFRILIVIGVTIGLVVLYKQFGRGDKKHIETGNRNHDGGRQSTIDASSKVGKRISILGLPLQSINLEIDKNHCTLTYQEAVPLNLDNKKPKLLLLHGKAFNSSTWDSVTGTMSALKTWGYRAVALNLVKSEADKCTGGIEDGKAALLHSVVKTLKLEKVVLVSPSASGAFSIPYIMTGLFQSEVAAYIPIAPVIDQKIYTEDKFKSLNKVKTMLVLGEKDDGIGKASLALLQHIPSNPKIVTIPGAGHACYVEKPAIWHTELKLFLDSLLSS